MVNIQVQGVDERDSSWEDHGPRFRVYLHDSDEDSTKGVTSTHDITGADVLQVIDWAQRQANGTRTYAVALVLDDSGIDGSSPGRGRGLIWLIGADGNDATDGFPEEGARHQRMLIRRERSVGIPPVDAFPGPSTKSLDDR